MLWVDLAGVLLVDLACVGVKLAGLLGIVHSIVLLWAGARLPFLSVPEQAPLSRWWILVGVNLLLILWGLDEGQIGRRHPTSAVHGKRKEDGGHDQEAGDRNTNTCTDSQSVPANHIVEAEGGRGVSRNWGEARTRARKGSLIVITVFSHHSRIEQREGEKSRHCMGVELVRMS